jgi:hypothetical protein
MRTPSRGMYVLCLASIVFATGCAMDASRTTATFNQGAELVGELPMNPLAWRIISSSIDPGNGTMSTLCGNDVAVDYARAHSQHDYPPGSVLSLVTWTQTEDSRWFGARIPAEPKSVEFMTVSFANPGGPQYSYEAYTGNPLKKTSAPESGAPPDRIAYFLSSRAAVMP